MFHIENFTYSNAVISSHIKNLVAGTNFSGVTVSLQNKIIKNILQWWWDFGGVEGGLGGRADLGLRLRNKHP